MKYRLLSKEQFEALHEEFSKFLVAQEIDKKTWDQIKNSASKKVQLQLENFSDMVWEEVLSKTVFIEHFSEKSINLFQCNSETIIRLVVEVNNSQINLLDKEGFSWFLNNSNESSINYLKGEKKYDIHRNKEIFNLIELGGMIGDGKLFEAINKLINPLNNNLPIY